MGRKETGREVTKRKIDLLKSLVLLFFDVVVIIAFIIDAWKMLTTVLTIKTTEAFITQMGAEALIGILLAWMFYMMETVRERIDENDTI